MENKYKDFKVKFYNTECRIHYIDRVFDENNEYIYGRCTPSYDLYISLNDTDNNPLSDTQIQLTLFHELTHAMLNIGNYFRTSDEEPLVEWLANCLFVLHNNQNKLPQ